MAASVSSIRSHEILSKFIVESPPEVSERRTIKNEIHRMLLGSH